MGCSGRVKVDDLRPEQKWDFISLNDFKSSSCLNIFAYGYLWVSLLISVAVYGVDTFTAVNLLAFNKWSGEFKPVVSFDVQKWIFAGCIIASWVNLGFEHLRATRVIRRGAVAESFLDSLAVRLQSIRIGKGRGWRRFLVFAELTKSKKGAEYVALFTYFAFQSWIRIIFCQGPRQVLNALTLYSVFKLNITGTDTSTVGTTLVTFFQNIGKLAEEDHQQAVILSGMVFTLVIWVFGALSLLLAMLFYVLFLWHYIPNADGGLSGYCERKVNRRLAKIVSVKVNKAIEDEERRRIKADARALKKGEKPAGRQATLPTLFDDKGGDKLPEMPMMNRNDTMATLPVYSSRPGTPSGQPTLPGFELDSLDQKRPFPNRSVTGSSAASYASNAPLMGNASDMGYGRSASPAPSLPPLDTSAYPAQPLRTATSNSNFSRGPLGGPPRMPSAMGDRGYTASPVSYTDGRSPSSAFGQSPASGSVDSYGRPMPRMVDQLRSNTPAGPAPSMGRRTPFDEGLDAPRSAPYDNNGRSSPAPSRGPNDSQGSIDGYGRASPAPRSPMNPGGYQPYNPNMRSASSASPAPSNPNFPSDSRGPPQQYRNMTDPGPRGPPQDGNYFGGAAAPPMPRPGTAQGQAQRLAAQNTGNSINRLASPAPYNGGGTQSPSFGGPGTPPMGGPTYRR
ncbi:uncharacterized protein PAC_09843 [Phialocephala subalpina]|uniref:Vacuolar membrane protein n=1 Tax=Phialocephala subalpina TaxID=576137 RepID=A0A1L7X4J0_9HELO|nr:uncharacterized protein PAC_09843 [Phialocephala subalpina]